MRNFAIAILFMCACEPDVGDLSDGATDTTDATDATATLDAPNDAALDAGADGPSVVLHLKCAQGDPCEAGAPVCCATLAFDAKCLLDTVTAACATQAECPTTLEPFCTPTETVRLCATTSDCTEVAYDKCCTFPITGYAQTIVMCASQKMADAVDASCL